MFKKQEMDESKSILLLDLDVPIPYGKFYKGH